jgi:hypothetical protein
MIFLSPVKTRQQCLVAIFVGSIPAQPLFAKSWTMPGASFAPVGIASLSPVSLFRREYAPRRMLSRLHSWSDEWRYLTLPALLSSDACPPGGW